MAPFKSTLARSASKLLGVFRDRDTSLRGYVQQSRFNNFTVLSVPTSIDASGEWDLQASNLVLSSSDTYDIGATLGSVAVRTHVWGAGGGGGSPAGASGGAGGFTVGDLTLVSGTTYKFVIGDSSGNSSNAGAPSNFGPGNVGSGGVGGGYSGVFTTSISQANAIIMAGGGGGAGGSDEGTHGDGGAGGGSTGVDGSGSPQSSDGDGGTQFSGGSGGPGNAGSGSNGGPLSGGNGGPRGNSGGGGGGGGSGYYGGGGGGGVANTSGNGGGGGGGGSGYLHPTLVSNGTTSQGSGGARVETSPLTPLIPGSAGRGNNADNQLGRPNANRGGLGCIVIELSS